LVPASRIEKRKLGKLWVVILCSVVPASWFNAGDGREEMCGHQCSFVGRISGREDLEQVEEGEA